MVWVGKLSAVAGLGKDEGGKVFDRFHPTRLELLLVFVIPVSSFILLLSTIGSDSMGALFIGMLGHLLALPGWIALILVNIFVPFYSFHNGSAWELLSSLLSSLFFAGMCFIIRRTRTKAKDLP
jgi:hypothetical protein